MGYLTKENLDQIRKYLGKEGVKDSSFDEKADLTGSEYMTLLSTMFGSILTEIKSNLQPVAQ